VPYSIYNFVAKSLELYITSANFVWTELHLEVFTKEKKNYLVGGLIYEWRIQTQIPNTIQKLGCWH